MGRFLDFQRVRPLVATFLCVALAFISAHALMERLSVWAERDQGAYLWWREEMMQLFTPTNHVGRGEGRILLTGPSEIREALLPDVMSETLGRSVYQHALSLGTLDAVVLQLEYIERIYGPTAMPDVLVVGVTPRFASNVPALDAGPFRDYVGLYSPYLRIDADRVELVEKGWLQSLASRARRFAHQPKRYKGALRTLKRELLGGDDFKLRPSKFHHRGVLRKRRYFRMVEEEGRIPWPLEKARPAIERGFARLTALCKRHDVELVIIAMPEGTWARSDLHYPPGYYGRFLSLIRRESGVDVLNLRAFLRDGEFHDWCHPTLPGARRVTARVSEYILSLDSLRK